MTRAVARHLVPPAGEDMRVAQGTIRSWSSTTFANVVDIDGQNFTDLPVASGVEALTYQAGDVVLVEQWFPGGKKGELGLGTAWIRGRVITPGTGAAEQVIQFFQTELAKQISSEVFADRIFSADEDGQVNISHTSFSFVSATGGPTLTDVPITAAGRAIVFASASVGTDTANAGTEIGGFMSYEVTGASSVAPVTRNAVQLDFLNDTDDNSVGISASRASLLTGLNEGLHTFEAKYQVTAFGASDEAIFLFRNLTVIAF